MKVILEFDGADDDYEMHSAINATEWRALVSDMREFLRSKLKHGHAYKTPDEALVDINRELYEQLNDRNLPIE